MFYISSSDEEENSNCWSHNQNGSEVWLEPEEYDDDQKIEHIRNKPVLDRRHAWLSFFQKVGEVDNEKHFHELDRLEREGEKWYIDPSGGSIVGRPDEEYEH